MATLTFNVVGEGAAGLSLQTDLADHPSAGQTANNINHQDTASSVTAVAGGTSTTTPTSSPSSSPGPSETPNPSSSSNPTQSPTSTTGPSPTIPELPGVAAITMLIVIATATLALSTKLVKNKKTMHFPI
jgi:hypothetical protein